jgi:hypothetical protein
MFLLLFLMGLSLFFYFIPTLLANNNKKQNIAAIGMLNLFLGWTVIGWVLALVWAVSKDTMLVQQVAPAASQQGAVPRPLVPPPPAPPAVAQKKCPDCAELVLAEAKKCRFCNHEFRNVGSLVGHSSYRAGKSVEVEKP